MTAHIARIRAVFNDRHGSGGRLLRNTLLLYIVQIGGYVLPLITLPYLARVLNPEKFGIVAFAQNFNWYFITLVEYGFNLTATREAAIRRDDPDALSRLFTDVMCARALLACVGFLLMTAVVLALPQYRSEYKLFAVSYLAVAGTAVFPLWLYQGLETLRVVAARDLGAKILIVAAVFALVRNESDYVLAAGIQSGGALVASLAGLVPVFRSTSVRFRRTTFREVWQTLADGWHVFLSSAIANLFVATNILVLGTVYSSRAVGVFSAAWRVMTPLRSLVQPLSAALYPHISRMAADNTEHAVRFLRRNVLLVAVPFGLMSLVLCVTAPWIVPLAFGPEYGESIPVLMILAFCPVLLSMSNYFATYYMLAFGYTEAWARLIRRAGIANFAALALGLATLPGPVATALAIVVLDLYAVIASVLFFRRTSGAAGRLPYMKP